MYYQQFHMYELDDFNYWNCEFHFFSCWLNNCNSFNNKNGNVTVPFYFSALNAAFSSWHLRYSHIRVRRFYFSIHLSIDWFTQNSNFEAPLRLEFILGLFFLTPVPKTIFSNCYYARNVFRDNLIKSKTKSQINKTTS